MAPTSSSVRPYCGREPYIFISYAHRNETEVYRIIERMQAEGYRIWYDRGIDPGTEWADNIAERVASCDYFIAFITKEYLKSTNCLDELSFARDKEKKRLLVYLSNVTLPDGISMRSNRLQAIHKYAYAQEEEFYEKLFRAKGIESSREASSDRPESAVAPHVEEEETTALCQTKRQVKSSALRNRSLLHCPYRQYSPAQRVLWQRCGGTGGYFFLQRQYAPFCF